MVNDGIFRRRHLPHWDVDDKPYFITGCLHGSLSAAGLQDFYAFRDKLKAKPKPEHLSESDWEHQKSALQFKFIDNLLDGRSPVNHLADPRMARVVEDSFGHFANLRYVLFAWCVMPSHHHWLFQPIESWANEAVVMVRKKRGKFCTARELICQSVQSYTATMCNRILKKSGSFWQGETFDHWVRDDDELLQIIDYIENNPVKAGLIANAADWRWSSAHHRLQSGTPKGQPLTLSGKDA